MEKKEKFRQPTFSPFLTMFSRLSFRIRKHSFRPFQFVFLSAYTLKFDKLKIPSHDSVNALPNDHFSDCSKFKAPADDKNKCQ